MGSEDDSSPSNSRQVINQMSSHASPCFHAGFKLPTCLTTKRKRRFIDFSTYHFALVLLLLHCCWSPFCYDFTLANPVEEEPSNLNSESTGSLSFSINSPRQADGRRIQDSNARDQKSSSSKDARKGIKVRLSDEMKQHMLWSFKGHNNDKARIQEAILGFPSDFVITETPALKGKHFRHFDEIGDN